METPDKVTPRTLINQFAEQQNSSLPVTRSRRHVEKTPTEKLSPAKTERPPAEYEVALRKSPRHIRADKFYTRKSLTIQKNQSRQVGEDCESMDSRDRITPRTMINNFLDQQKTTQPITRKRKHEEEMLHERSGRKSSSPNKSAEPASKKRRSALMKKAMMNSLNKKQSPRTIIKQLATEVSEETPVQAPIRRSSRLSDVSSATDSLIVSIKQPTPIEATNKSKLNKLAKSKTKRTQRNYSFTSPDQREQVTDRAVRVEKNELLGQTEKIGGKNFKNLKMSETGRSSEVIPSSRSPSPLGKSLKPCDETSLSISSPVINSAELLSKIDHIDQSTVGRSSFSNRQKKMIVSPGKQRKSSGRNIRSDFLSDSDVFASTESYSASDKTSPLKNDPITSNSDRRKTKRGNENHSDVTFSDKESIDEHSSQVNALLNSLSSPVHSINSSSPKTESTLPSNFSSPTRRSSKLSRKESTLPSKFSSPKRRSSKHSWEESNSPSKFSSPTRRLSEHSQKESNSPSQFSSPTRHSSKHSQKESNSPSQFSSPMRRSSIYSHTNQEEIISSSLHSVQSESYTNDSAKNVEKYDSNFQEDTVEYSKNVTVHSAYNLQTDSVVGSEKSFHGNMSLSPASSARIELRSKSKPAEEPETQWIDNIDGIKKSIHRKLIPLVNADISLQTQSTSSQQPVSILVDRASNSFEDKLRLSPTISSNSSHRISTSKSSLQKRQTSMKSSGVSLENTMDEHQSFISDKKIASSPSSNLRRRISRPDDGPSLFHDGRTEVSVHSANIIKSLNDSAQTSLPGSVDASSPHTKSSEMQSHVMSQAHRPVTGSSETLSPRSSRSIRRRQSQLNSEEHLAVSGNLNHQSPRSFRSFDRNESRLSDRAVTPAARSSCPMSPQSLRSIQRRKSRLNVEENLGVSDKINCQSPRSLRSIQGNKSQLSDRAVTPDAGDSGVMSPQSLRSNQRRKSRLNVEEQSSITDTLKSRSPVPSSRGKQGNTSQLIDGTHSPVATVSLNVPSPRSQRSNQRAKNQLNDETINSDIGNITGQSSQFIKSRQKRQSEIREHIHTVNLDSKTLSPPSLRNIQRRSSRLNVEMHISGSGDSSVYLARTGERLSHQVDEKHPSTTVNLSPGSSPPFEQEHENQLTESDKDKSPDRLRPTLSPSISDRMSRSNRLDNSLSKPVKSDKDVKSSSIMEIGKKVFPDRDSQVQNNSSSGLDNDERKIVEQTEQPSENLNNKTSLLAENDLASLTDTTAVQSNSARHSGTKFVTSTPHVSRSLSLENQFSAELSLSRIEDVPTDRPCTSTDAVNGDGEETKEVTAYPPGDDENTKLHEEDETIVPKLPTDEAKNKKKTKKSAITAQRKCSLPRRTVKNVFNHFAKCRVSKDAWDAIESASDKFFKYLVRDLEAYTTHAHRKSINEEDVELLMKRQGFVTDNQSVYTLVEKYLPLEDRREIIPMARSGNMISP